MIENNLNRLIELSSEIIDDLKNDRPLSYILPKTRLLSTVNGDAIQAAWLDNEIYGINRVPFAKRPRATPEEKEGIAIFLEMHKSTPYEKYFGRASQQQKEDSNILAFSINELENLYNLYLSDFLQNIPQNPTQTESQAVYMGYELKRTFNNVKAYLYEYVGKVQITAIQKKDNITLLGPDYRIVIDNLDTINTGVGQELEAALTNLKSDNPANWKLAALGCRSVLIKLSDVLWRVPCKSYLSVLDNTKFDLVGKEKNKLLAFIDYHFQKNEVSETKEKLKHVHGKVHTIYDVGSKAKRSIKHEEAQNIIIDTFEFVAILDEITNLEPLEKL